MIWKRRTILNRHETMISKLMKCIFGRFTQIIVILTLFFFSFSNSQLIKKTISKLIQKQPRKHMRNKFSLLLFHFFLFFKKMNAISTLKESSLFTQFLFSLKEKDNWSIFALFDIFFVKVNFHHLFVYFPQSHKKLKLC